MVYLERDQLKALRARARRERISLAELVRRVVARHLDEAEPHTEVAEDVFGKIVAMGASGRADTAARHDAYLADVLRREHAR